MATATRTITRTAIRTASLALALAASVADASPASEAAFERGLARFQAKDFAGAIAPLAEAHAADPDDADTALLLGIAYYRTGQLALARPLLEQAERDSDADGKASARVFLGLIAEQGGDVDSARDYFGLVARSSTSLGASGRLLLEESGPERWSVAGIARAGYDSNVALQPGSPGRGKGKGLGDGDLTLLGAATGRPVDGTPLMLDETLLYRHYAQDTDYDMLADVVGATYTLSAPASRAALAYHFDASTLGGTRYELAHLVDVSARHSLPAGTSVGAAYRFAARDYGRAYAGYSALVQSVVLDVARGTPGTPHELSLGYVWQHEPTDDPTLAYNGNGARAALRLRAAKSVEIRATALAIDRRYNFMSAGRRDEYLTLDATMYVDLSRTWGFMAGTALTRNVSNANGFDYTKLVLFAGLLAVTSD
jgi:tetratricopeptide (TPR) repeat protein